MDVRVTTDIGVHAGTEALATMHRILDTCGSGPEKLVAASIAQAYLEFKLEGLRRLMANEGAPYAEAVDAVKQRLVESGEFERFQQELKAKGPI